MLGVQHVSHTINIPATVVDFGSNLRYLRPIGEMNSHEFSHFSNITVNFESILAALYKKVHGKTMSLKWSILPN